MKRLVFILMAALLLAPAVLSCVEDQCILKISGVTNAHAELYNGANYATEICYDTIFGAPYVSSAPHTCTATNGVLQLSALTNAHVEMFGLPSYPQQVCFGDLVCDFVGPDGLGAPRPCSVFDSAAQCLATVSAVTNAHISSLCSGAGSYLTKVCCKDTANAPVGPCGNGFVDAGEQCGELGLPVCAGTGVCQNCVCVPGARFQIVSFDLSENFVSVELGNSVPVNAVVNIRNIGAGAGNASLEVVVKNAVGAVLDNKNVSIPGLAGGATSAHTLVFDIPSDWGPGNYIFYASVYNDGPPVSLEDQKIRLLTLQIDQPAPIPELSAMLLPLIALSVLTLILVRKTGMNRL